MFDWMIAAARFLQFAPVLILFGSSLFQLYAGADVPARGWTWSRRCVLAAGAGGIAGVLWWLAAQAAIFFPDAGAVDPGAIWTLATGTAFGRAGLLRAALLALSVTGTLSLPHTRPVWIVQAMLGAMIAATFAWTGHGAYDSGWEGAVHRSADILHLAAAGVWIGALVPLSILILRASRVRTPDAARSALTGLEKFSGLGPAVVAVLALTGLVNSWFLVGIAQWQAMVTSGYGIVLTMKLGVFLAMLALAASNRFRLVPLLKADVLSGYSPSGALRALRRSVLTETALALFVLALVAILGMLEPPAAA